MCSPEMPAELHICCICLLSNKKQVWRHFQVYIKKYTLYFLPTTVQNYTLKHDTDPLPHANIFLLVTSLAPEYITCVSVFLTQIEEGWTRGWELNSQVCRRHSIIRGCPRLGWGFLSSSPNPEHVLALCMSCFVTARPPSSFSVSFLVFPQACGG